MPARDIAKIYTDLLHIHKRLPLDADDRLMRGEVLEMYSGNAQYWTSKLELRMHEGSIAATMHINSALPLHMQNQLQAYKEVFEKKVDEMLRSFK